MKLYVTIIDRLRYAFVGLLVIGSLLTLSFLLSSLMTNGASAESMGGNSETLSTDSPNVVTNIMSMAVNNLNNTANTVSLRAGNSLNGLKVVPIQLAKPIAQGAQNSASAIAHGTVAGLTFTGRGLGTGFGFVGRSYINAASAELSVPGKVVGFVTKPSLVTDFIRPSDDMSVPVINPNSPELQAAVAALPPAADNTPKAPTNNLGPDWPIHGTITTEFGVSDWPYQKVHTGLDISDGNRPGITPVKPFRPGKVVEVIHSNSGLGNHITIDHGGGVSSVYGHLASTAVSVGQAVDTATIIGLEGTTGASTGTHLHFEIRVNGQAANPHKFISGNP